MWGRLDRAVVAGRHGLPLILPLSLFSSSLSWRLFFDGWCTVWVQDERAFEPLKQHASGCANTQNASPKHGRLELDADGDINLVGDGLRATDT